MTSTNGAERPLPDTVTITAAFARRLPSQRVLDTVTKCEDGASFTELAERSWTRVIAFRALLRDYPDRDPTSLWMHAYDVETDIVDGDGADPTAAASLTRAPDFVGTGGSLLTS
jgi:hypothetical protein